jgi:hypothetical protein
MSSLLKLITATAAGLGMKMPPIPIIAGNGAVPVVGYVMVGENVMDLPPSVTVMVSVEPEKEAVTDVGSAGIIPSSSVWKSVL